MAATGLQQVEVFYRGLGGLHRSLGAVDLVVLLRQGHADRVVHAAGAAGEDVDEGRCSDGRGAGGEGRSGSEQAQAFGQSHGWISVSFLLIGAAC